MKKELKKKKCKMCKTEFKPFNSLDSFCSYKCAKLNKDKKVDVKKNKKPSNKNQIKKKSKNMKGFNVKIRRIIIVFACFPALIALFAFVTKNRMQRQVKELPRRLIYLLIPAAFDRLFCCRQGDPICGKCLTRAAKHIARKLIQQNNIGEGPTRIGKPERKPPVQRPRPSRTKSIADLLIQRFVLFVPPFWPNLIKPKRQNLLWCRHLSFLFCRAFTNIVPATKG